MPSDERDITGLLARWSRGDTRALRQLVDHVYPDLRRLARQQLNGRRRDQMLDTTGLVHEAYIKLAAGERAAWNDRQHFFAVAARAMRQILVDLARERLTAKRGSGRRPEELNENAAAVEARSAELIALDVALSRLTGIDSRLTHIVECRYFAGYSEQETAEVLGVSERTVQREWKLARSWLYTELMS